MKTSLNDYQTMKTTATTSRPSSLSFPCRNIAVRTHRCYCCCEMDRQTDGQTYITPMVYALLSGVGEWRSRGYRNPLSVINTPSHTTYDQFLATSHHYRGKNRKRN